jgi:hypothetical protein
MRKFSSEFPQAVVCDFRATQETIIILLRKLPLNPQTQEKFRLWKNCATNVNRSPLSRKISNSFLLPIASALGRIPTRVSGSNGRSFTRAIISRCTQETCDAKPEDYKALGY